MDTFKPADYYRHVCDKFAAYVQKGPVTGCIHRMKHIQYKVLGISDNKILDNFIHGLEPIIGCEVFKENPQVFEEACIFTE